MKLGGLISDPQKLATLKGNAKRCGKPRAAFDVATKALELSSVPHERDAYATRRQQQHRN